MAGPVDSKAPGMRIRRSTGGTRAGGATWELAADVSEGAAAAHADIDELDPAVARVSGQVPERLVMRTRIVLLAADGSPNRAIDPRWGAAATRQSMVP
jgi:hypothetical protein